MKVAKKRAGAFNTVRVSSAGRRWIVDNGGDDEHAMPNAELAEELTGQTFAARKTRFDARVKSDISHAALLNATFATTRQLEDASAPLAIPRAAGLVLEARVVDFWSGSPGARAAICTWLRDLGLVV